MTRQNPTSLPPRLASCQPSPPDMASFPLAEWVNHTHGTFGYFPQWGWCTRRMSALIFSGCSRPSDLEILSYRLFASKATGWRSTAYGREGVVMEVQS